MSKNRLSHVDEFQGFEIHVEGSQARPDSKWTMSVQIKKYGAVVLPVRPNDDASYATAEDVKRAGVELGRHLIATMNL